MPVLFWVCVKNDTWSCLTDIVLQKLSAHIIKFKMSNETTTHTSSKNSLACYPLIYCSCIMFMDVNQQKLFQANRVISISVTSELFESVSAPIKAKIILTNRNADFPWKEKGCFSAEKLKAKLSTHDWKWTGIKYSNTIRDRTVRCIQAAIYMHKFPFASFFPIYLPHILLTSAGN